MIYSMTAFARQEAKSEWGNATWEIRSINHRYLDISIRLPESLNILEPLLREKIRSQLQRGKIEINLRYKPAPIADNQFAVNQDLVKRLIGAKNEVARLADETTTINLIDILRWPNVLLAPEENTQQIQADLLKLFDQALTDLVAARAREGESLQKLLLQNLTAMQTAIDKVKHKLPEILKSQREKLIERFNEAQLTLEPTRIEQEMVLFAQKIDVKEELDRLETHIKEVKRTLQQTGSNGRRLDFLMQELNREANTLGSKSASTDTTLIAVELKVLIEQMREQIQNIE